MKQPVTFRRRPLIALATLASVLSLGGAIAARADDDDDRGHDGRNRYYSNHRYRDDYRDGYHDRGWDRGHHYGHYKRDKHYDKHRRDYRHDRYYYDGGYRHGGYYDRGYGPGRFVAPHYLYRRDYPAYDHYFRGSAYYAPHRHSHRIYLFPVIVGGYTQYRPYAYCGDGYFPGHYGYDRYDGAHGHFGLHFNF
jgi:hypothetical protein